MNRPVNEPSEGTRVRNPPAFFLSDLRRPPIVPTAPPFTDPLPATSRPFVRVASRWVPTTVGLSTSRRDDLDVGTHPWYGAHDYFLSRTGDSASRVRVV